MSNMRTINKRTDKIKATKISKMRKFVKITRNREKKIQTFVFEFCGA